MCCMPYHDHEGPRSNDDNGQCRVPWYKTARGLTTAILAGLVLYTLWYFFWTDHRAHILAFLPYLIFLACPLMHLLHRGGHGHGNAASAAGPRHDHDRAAGGGL